MLRLPWFVLQQKNRTVVDFGFVPDTSRNGGSFQTIAKPVGKVKSSGAELELAGELPETGVFLLATHITKKSKYKQRRTKTKTRCAYCHGRLYTQI